MVVFVVLGLAVLGATTWLVQDQPFAHRPHRQHRLAGLGLFLSVVTLAGAMIAAVILAG